MRDYGRTYKLKGFLFETLSCFEEANIEKITIDRLVAGSINTFIIVLSGICTNRGLTVPSADALIEHQPYF